MKGNTNYNGKEMTDNTENEEEGVMETVKEVKIREVEKKTDKRGRDNEVVVIEEDMEEHRGDRQSSSPSGLRSPWRCGLPFITYCIFLWLRLTESAARLAHHPLLHSSRDPQPRQYHA